MPAPAAYFLLGPTASGKTSVSLALAPELDAEIVCMDSMQVYRDIPVASAQPSSAERAAVPHHLFEAIDLAAPFDAATYARRAALVASEIEGRGRQVLFVGGTALYFKALVEGLADLPPADAALRAQLRASWDLDGGVSLRSELTRVDPEAAARIGPADYRRTERALEVYRLTGEALSTLHARPVEPPLRVRGAVALRPPREWLRARVVRRHEAMQTQGLVAEMHGLWERFRQHPAALASLQAIGYRPFADHFEGRSTLEAALQTMLHQTQRLLRHQETWLRKLALAQSVDPVAAGESLATRVHAALSTGHLSTQ